MTNQLYCPKKFNIEFPVISNQKSKLWLFKSLTNFKYPDSPLEKKEINKYTQLIQLTGKIFEPPFIYLSNSKQSKGFIGNSNHPKLCNLKLKQKINLKFSKNKFDIKNYKYFQEKGINDNLKEEYSTKSVDFKNIDDYSNKSENKQNKKCCIKLKSEMNRGNELEWKSGKYYQSLESKPHIYSFLNCSSTLSHISFQNQELPQISTQYVIPQESISSNKINKYLNNGIRIKNHPLQTYKKLKFITNSIDLNQDNLNGESNSKIRVGKSVKNFYKIHLQKKKNFIVSRNIPYQESVGASNLRKTPAYNAKYSKTYKHLLSLRIK